MGNNHQPQEEHPDHVAHQLEFLTQLGSLMQICSCPKPKACQAKIQYPDSIKEKRLTLMLAGHLMKANTRGQIIYYFDKPKVSSGRLQSNHFA